MMNQSRITRVQPQGKELSVGTHQDGKLGSGVAKERVNGAYSYPQVTSDEG